VGVRVPPSAPSGARRGVEAALFPHTEENEYPAQGQFHHHMGGQRNGRRLQPAFHHYFRFQCVCDNSDPGEEMHGFEGDLRPRLLINWTRKLSPG